MEKKKIEVGVATLETSAKYQISQAKSIPDPLLIEPVYINFPIFEGFLFYAFITIFPFSSIYFIHKLAWSVTFTVQMKAFPLNKINLPKSAIAFDESTLITFLK